MSTISTKYKKKVCPPTPDGYDENEAKKTPTWKKWQNLKPGESLTYVKTYVKGRGNDEKYLLRRLSYKRRHDQKRREEMEALGCTQRQLPTARKEAKKKQKNNNNKKEQNKTSRSKMSSSNKRKRKSTYSLPENDNNENNNNDRQKEERQRRRIARENKLSSNNNKTARVYKFKRL